MKKGLGWYIVLLIGYIIVIALLGAYLIKNIIEGFQAGQIVETVVGVSLGLGLGTVLGIAHNKLYGERGD